MSRVRYSGPVKSTAGFEIGAAASGFTAETNTTAIDSSGNLYQAGTQITASAVEINRICDSSAKLVSITGDIALTQALHANRICLMNKAAGIAITLPEATGTGDIYTLILGTALTSGSITITTADTTNADLVGQVVAVDLDSATTPTVYQSLQATGNDKITMNRTTQGGINVYVDWYRLTDIATDVWWVEGNFLVPTGSNPVTPFSST